MRNALRGLRVGALPYLNFAAYRPALETEGPLWVEAPPRRLGELAAAGALDAAPLASRDALALDALFRPLGDLGLASRGPVASVLLFSRRPVETLAGRRIALTTESRTSRGLLRILLAERFGPDAPRYVEEPQGADAWLVIGDAALALAAEAPQPHVLDLGEAWTRWTGLPFVWARWVVRRDLAPGRAAALRRLLEGALDRPPAGTARVPARFGPEAVAAYLARFVHRLGPQEEAGLRRFHEELIRHDLLHHHARSRSLGSAA
jgi:chorismate dehydratase